MFRAYDRSKEGLSYGRKNYNKHVPIIFDRQSFNYNDMSFPSNFERFRKSEKSSVSRISNVLLSSSPIDFIRTPLNKFLDRVITNEDFLRRQNIVALVGGAGNGKTESLGYVLSKIQNKYELFKDHNYLNNCIEDSISNNKGYFTSFKSDNFRLSFIQDATSVWSKNGAFLSKRESIEMAINHALMDDTPGLLVICINRGVLSSLLRELNGTLLQIFELIQNQVSQEGYVNETDNLATQFNTKYLISSYPLDKMRLFEGGGIHSQFVEQMGSKHWESIEYRSHFTNSQRVCGSLLDALELWNGGLLSFRDYLNYLFLFYAKIHDNEWMNIPLIKIWFGNQFHTVSDVFDKVVSNSPEPLFGKSLSYLTQWRKKSNEISDLDLFDPLKVTGIVSSDDVQFLLDNLSQTENIQYFICQDIQYPIYGYYKDLLYKLSRIDNWIDSYTTNTPADKYRVKRYLFNLTAQVMTFIICEKQELFFLSQEKRQFLESPSEDAINLLANALNLRKSARNEDFIECVQSLADELWVHKENPSIKQRIKLKVNIKEVISNLETKPRFPSRIFVVQAADKGSFNIKVDFRQYYYLLEFKGHIQLYHENYSVSFSIWVNSLKERLRPLAEGSDGYIDIFEQVININAEI
jgi:Cdc6-like AAA superfamily ATPase